MILIIFVIAIMLAFYMQKKLQARREAEHERRMERFEKLVDLLKKHNSDKKVEVSVRRIPLETQGTVMRIPKVDNQ